MKLVYTYARTGSYNQTVHDFNATNEDGLTYSVKSVANVITKFEVTGSVQHIQNPGRPRTSEEDRFTVLASAVEEPRHSVRQRATDLQLSKCTIHNILKIEKFYPYKIKLVHELNEDDSD